MAKVLALLTDAFGGQGGIAAFNRDLLCALSADPLVREVVALPRYCAEDITSRGPLPVKLRYEARATRSTRQYLRSFLSELGASADYDLVLCAHLHLLPLAWIASKRRGCPLVLVILGIEAWTNPKRRMISLCLPAVRHVWSISEYTTTQFLQWARVHPQAEFSVLRCAVDFDKFPRRDRSTSISPKDASTIRLLTISRMLASEPYKGIDEVLQVVAGNPQFEYIICGEGDDRPRLMQLAEDLAVTDRVRFAGYVSERVKLEHLQSSDVFVLASRGEGFGIVYIEALAAGIPVVACRSAGAIETLRDGQLGMLVEPGNRVQLEQAILAAKERGAPPLGALEEYSIERFDERVALLLRTVLNESVPG